jgi:hypothetical protein
MPGGGWESVMRIVPSFAHTKYAKDKIVSALVMARVGTQSPQVTSITARVTNRFANDALLGASSSGGNSSAGLAIGISVVSVMTTFSTPSGKWKRRQSQCKRKKLFQQIKCQIEGCTTTQVLRVTLRNNKCTPIRDFEDFTP